MTTKTHVSFNVNFIVFTNRLLFYRRRRFSFPLLLATATYFRQVDEREGGVATIIKTGHLVRGGKGFIIIIVVDTTVTGVVVR